MTDRKPVAALRDVVVLPGSTMYIEIGRQKTLQAVNHAIHGDKQIVMVAQRDAGIEEPEQSDLFKVATLAEVKQMISMPEKMTRVVITGIRRVNLEKLYPEDDCFYGEITDREQSGDLSYTLEIIAMVRGLKDLFQVYASETGKISSKLSEEVMEQTDLVHLIDRICASVPIHYQLKQRILEEEDVFSRHEQLSLLLSREIAIQRIQKEISEQVKEQVDQNQKEYYLREQIKAIHKELGEEDAVSEADRYAEQLAGLKAPGRVKRKVREELQRFRKMNTNSSESAVIRGYLETLLSFPWKKQSKERLDVTHAAEVLDADHYGLEKVKERVLECLSVRALKPDAASPIICLVGPPGTGKTSIARSVAKALHRKYIRICLGGVRDEAELRGHRRTYVGAMPGRIVAGLKNAGSKNPVILLDEIDKLGSDYKGDPASALLEILDPEQNKHFSDHYIELPVDLSQVMFLCTANSLDLISRPLLDRMEVITLSGYTEPEKFHIAKDHLWEKQKNANGLTKSQISITDKALQTVIRKYTREAGVRGLEKKLAALCRKAAHEIATDATKKVRISERNLGTYLGKEVYHPNPALSKPETGVVRGLAWTSVGGDTLEVEAAVLDGTGKLELTGKLGDVMQESAKTALTYVRTQIGGKKDREYFQKHDIHVHVPEGAVPKDGPSAGVTMATALYSALMDIPVRSEVAMTGEISLRGRVLPIGGLKEKLLAAKASGIRTVVIPEENKKDIAEIEQDVLEGLQIEYASRIGQVWKHALVQ